MFYRKKPVVIEAIRWEGDESAERILDWAEGSIVAKVGRDRLMSLYITTLEGKLFASLGDFIIKGVQGEFYPCKPDIFRATYEEVDDVRAEG